MDKIYILKKNKLISGPYSLQTVKDRGLRNNDMIWYEGLNDWTPAEQLVDFEGSIKSSSTIQKSIFEKVFGFLK